MIKQMKVNTKCSLKGLWTLVNAVDNFEKLSIARNWVIDNELINCEQYNDLMMTLSYISRELYRTA